MKLRAFSAANQTRCSEDFKHPFFSEASWSYTDWMTAVAGEVGEAANLIKKHRRGEKIDLHEVALELADAVTYIDLLMTAMGYDLESVLIEKFNIVSDRINSKVVL